MNIESVAHLLMAYGYVIIFVAILLDCAGLPLPGELILLALGGMASRGHLDPVLGLAVAVIAALIGDSISYGAGRLGGARVLNRLRLRNRYSPGSTAVVFGRFVVGARVALAPLAGANRMPLRRFLLLDVLGATLWASAFVLVGYATRVDLGAIQRHWDRLTLGVEIALALAVAAYLVTRLARLQHVRASLAVALIVTMALGATRPFAAEIEIIVPQPAPCADAPEGS
jgi:membrane protein DedA with SNARE-associated domain